MAFGKDLRLTPWSFMSHFPPDPLFYGGSQRGAWAVASGAETSGRVPMLTHCRSAQLTKQVLLQDAMRLSGSTYTVGSGRRAGEADAPCQGEMSRRDRGGRDHPPLRKCGEAYRRAATRGRPYGRAGNLARGRTVCAPTEKPETRQVLRNLCAKPFDTNPQPQMTRRKREWQADRQQITS